MAQTRYHESNADRQRAYRHRQSQAVAERLAAKGLPPLPSIATMPGQRRWDQALQSVHATLQTVVEEMTDYHSERTEEWQESERGEEFEQRLDEITELLEKAQGLIEDSNAA